MGAADTPPLYITRRERRSPWLDDGCGSYAAIASNGMVSLRLKCFEATARDIGGGRCPLDASNL